MSDSGYFTDGYPTADIDDQDSNPALTNENADFVPGELKDATATTTGSIGLSTTQFTEIEYSIEATNNATDGQTYYFRLVDPSSTYAITYSVYPEVTLIEPIVWVSTTSSTITVETPQIKMVFDEAQGAGLDYLYGKTENNSSTGRGGDRGNYNVWSTQIYDTD